MPAKEGAPSRVIFGPQPITPEGMSRQEIRDASLAGVKARMKQTEGGKRLQNKVAVITGAGPILGIGTAAARLFAREGVRHLYLLDYSDTHLAALAEDVQKTYPSTKVTMLKADAASEESIKSLIDRVLKEEGHLDVFFANAGVSIAPPRKPAPPGATAEDKLIEELRLSARGMGETGVEEFNELMRINALSVFLAIKHASVAMGKICPEKGKKVPGGSIVCTASVAGLKANAGPVPYSASKAAVISLAQTTAYELVGTNIRVNAICPGLIETDMTRAAFGLARATGKVGKIGVLNPTLRQGLGFEVANLALWLASDESSYVNGQAMAVDGGLSASLPYIRPKL